MSCIVPLDVSLHPAFLGPIHFAILLMQVDEKQKSVLLSEVGYEAAEEILSVTDLYDPREQWASYLINAIKAKELFLKNVNYIVRGQEALIVDEFTGRVMQVNNRLSISCIVTQSAELQEQHQPEF